MHNGNDELIASVNEDTQRQMCYLVRRLNGLVSSVIPTFSFDVCMQGHS